MDHVTRPPVSLWSVSTPLSSVYVACGPRQGMWSHCPHVGTACHSRLQKGRRRAATHRCVPPPRPHSRTYPQISTHLLKLMPHPHARETSPQTHLLHCCTWRARQKRGVPESTFVVRVVQKCGDRAGVQKKATSESEPQIFQIKYFCYYTDPVP